MQSDTKSACLKRLHRTEAQVRGVARMVEQDRYRIDVVTQVSAIRAALARVEDEIIPDHIGHCVEHAIMSGDRAEQRRKAFELVDALGGWVVEIVKLWV
jgi:CsoR family transcriptional regulator, copper-sensing transcriptional repressor